MTQKQEIQSCVYEVSVVHQRRSPKRHTFSARQFWFCLDLDEVARWPKEGSPAPGWLGTRWYHGYRFCESDHLPNGQPGSLKQRLLQWINQQPELTSEQKESIGQVRLVTHLRVLGYVFNPVSFYYCATQTGQPVCVVVEVGNTHGEQKLFLLSQPQQTRQGRWVFRHQQPKAFYVSPFLELLDEFDFSVGWPQERLNLVISTRRQEVVVLMGSVEGERCPLNATSLKRLSFRYPLVTLQTIGLIHGHALLLWIKSIPIHYKHEAPEHQRGVLRLR